MEIFEFLKTVHDESIRLSENIKFDKTHPRHLHLVGLYGTLIELSGSIVTLIASKKRTGVPPLFRSMLEAYVEFKNLHEKAEYGYCMQASYLDQLRIPTQIGHPFRSKPASHSEANRPPSN